MQIVGSRAAAALLLAGVAVASVSAAPAAPAAGAAAGATPGRSGLNAEYVDPNVRPQDDVYRHWNGKWLDTFQIPADKATYGAFNTIDDETQEQLRGIVETLAKAAPGNGAATTEAQKIADLYSSFMDEPRLETLGFTPLQTSFATIDALADKAGIAALIARFNRTGAGAPLDLGIDPDQKDSTHYAVSLDKAVWAAGS